MAHAPLDGGITMTCRLRTVLYAVILFSAFFIPPGVQTAAGSPSNCAAWNQAPSECTAHGCVFTPGYCGFGPSMGASNRYSCYNIVSESGCVSFGCIWTPSSCSSPGSTALSADTGAENAPLFLSGVRCDQGHAADIAN
jgi:hypothetical protein